MNLTVNVYEELFFVDLFLNMFVIGRLIFDSHNVFVIKNYEAAF
jgi:hypothetical protein